MQAQSPTQSPCPSGQQRTLKFMTQRLWSSPWPAQWLNKIGQWYIEMQMCAGMFVSVAFYSEKNV